MHRRSLPLLLAAALALSSVAAAQLLPPAGGAIGQAAAGIGRLGTEIGERVDDSVSDAASRAGDQLGRLARLRADRLGALVRGHRDALEYDARGDPAVRGELIALDPTPELLSAAAGAGFALVEQGDLTGLGVAAARLRAPAGMSLARAERRLARLAPSAVVQSNPVYQQSGATAPDESAGASVAPGPGATIGLIDGGVAAHPSLPAGIVQRGFAAGAPAPGDHATAIASILIGRGPIRGVSPQSRLLAADIYGRDPRGGNALAIARALGWLATSGAAVVNISLAGPDNPLLARAVAAAGGRGLLLVAAVGNDGAAAPPAFPASYPQVIAVSGVDRRGRALIEAGRAAHLDFAAPGADLLAAKAGGGTARLRGTSFAAPFVTGRIARLSAQGPLSRARAIALLAAEARTSSAMPARLYGRGVICGECAAR